MTTGREEEHFEISKKLIFEESLKIDEEEHETCCSCWK
jgi:hypothetical protein